MADLTQPSKNRLILVENIYSKQGYLEILELFECAGIELSTNQRIDIAWLLLSSYILGTNDSYVQASGGNTSLKISNFMLIKASGKKLSVCLDINIFILVSRDDFDNKTLTFPNSPDLFESNLRPSIESAFHCLDCHKFVIHTHPIDIVRSTLVESDLEQHLRNIDKYNPVVIPYFRPGFELATAIKNSTIKNGENCYVLKNHGLVFGCDSGSRIIEYHDEIVEGFKVNSPIQKEMYPSNILNEYVSQLNSAGISASLPKSNFLHGIAFNDKITMYIRDLAIAPDTVVFLGNNNIFLDQAPENFKNIIQLLNGGKFICIKNMGIIIIGQEGAITETVELFLEMQLKIFLPLTHKKIENKLSPKEVNELQNWDAEKYRVSMLK